MSGVKKNQIGNRQLVIRYLLFAIRYSLCVTWAQVFGKIGRKKR